MQPDRVYAESKARTVDLVRNADVTTPVPACPGWTVHGVVAHLVSVAAAVAEGTLSGVPSDEWTEAQVVERAGRSMEELLAEWDEHAPAMEKALPEMRVPRPAVDAQTHEHDIRDALGAPPADFDFSLQLYLLGLDLRLRKNELPGLRVVAEDDTWEVGEGEPAATLTTTRYGLFRALAGRPGPELQWDGDAARFMPMINTFAAT